MNNDNDVFKIFDIYGNLLLEKGGGIKDEIFKADLRYRVLKQAFINGKAIKKCGLQYSTFDSSILQRVDFGGSDLSCVSFVESSIRNSSMRSVTARYANFERCDLRGTRFNNSDLSFASLHLANLTEVEFDGANLTGAFLGNPATMLTANWGLVSKELCGLLMRYDAANHPKGLARFDDWARGNGRCPYHDCKISRAAQFIESRDAWDADLPVLSAYDLMVRLIREKCSASDFHPTVTITPASQQV